MNDRRIPASVEARILTNRQHFRDLDAALRARLAAQVAQNPGAEIPGGRFRTKSANLEIELRFWEIKDDNALEEFLFDDLLAGFDDIHFGSAEWAAFPPGYRPLIEVLEFERHQQFEGWTAVSNHGLAEMLSIIQSYKILGLHDEARALSSVLDAFRDHGDSEPGFHDRMERAYRSAGHATPDIEDRMPFIHQFIRQHPGCFAA